MNDQELNDYMLELDIRLNTHLNAYYAEFVNYVTQDTLELDNAALSLIESLEGDLK